MAQLLLVEDDVAIRGALIRALTERGHAVSSTPTAMEALQLVVDSPPDLVILDLGLPDLDGFAALRMLRAISKVPVVVATARDDEADIVKVLDAGATITWSSRSASARSRLGSGPCCGVRRPTKPNAASRSSSA